ncbi:MAG TPA: hypothetical protein PLT15_04435 [Bacilli bacterium]|nr:hypothetical protein [Bacilli bacterium]
MSRTIITKSRSEFMTSINSEHMLGELCKESNAKYYEEKYPDITYNWMAYSMTEEESIQAANGLKKLAENVNDIFPRYQRFLGKNVTASDFKEIILRYAEDFEKSKGYKCI